MAATTPLPTNLKSLRGTARPCRLNSREPKPSKAHAKMPSGLTADEKKHWKSIAGDLEQAGILTVLDVQALRLYCRAYTRWHEANITLDEVGPVIKGKNGSPVLSPYFRVSQTYFEQMMSLLREFGMTPSSRTRIHSEKEPEEDDLEVMARKNREKRRMAHEGV